MSEIIELPPWLAADDWQDFIEHRKEIRKPMTDRAQRRMMKQLIALHNQGHDVVSLIDRAIRNGWQDVRVYENEKQVMKPAAHQATQLPDYGQRSAPETAHAAVRGALKLVRGR